MVSRGVTLIELMVVIIIVSILVVAGLPLLTPTVERGRLTASANQVVGAFNFARTEAIRRAQPVIISSTDSSTAGNDWGNGIQVWQDADGDNNFDANELLRQFDPVPQPLTLDAAGNINSITYQASGLTNLLVNFTLDLCGDFDRPGRQLALTIGGRTSVVTQNCP